MKLARYLSDNGISQAAFARQVGRSQASVNRLLNGEQTPSLELIQAIDQATDGAVQARDFYEEAAA